MYQEIQISLTNWERKEELAQASGSAWFSRYPHVHGLWDGALGENNKPQRSCGTNGDFRDHRSFGPVTLPFVPRDLIFNCLLNDHDLEERKQEEELLSAGPCL